MQLNTYLHFNGNCEEAFKFYEKTLRGKIEAILTFEGTPNAQHVPPEWRKKVMHARLTADDQALMGTDVPPTAPGGGYQKPAGFAVSFMTKDPAEADRVFAALAENGRVNMPIQETFWAARFGMCVDRFGIPWMVNCERAAASASH
ncbi:MAG TPA: VOC family protein [Candidatus Acidoferrales bacterium]|jgi:PhnB protein|nr:VOC family protein [Candidatus Acidoferrales bacterium]